MKYIAGSDRSEALLLPGVLDDYIGAENPVRFIDAFIGQLDLKQSGFYQRCRNKLSLIFIPQPTPTTALVSASPG